MPGTDARVDAYIAKSADVAKPILTRIRKVVHKGCPDVEETMKWGVPSFDYHRILCNMAAFKRHCGWIFWKGSLLKADGARFRRITSMKDLPPARALVALVKEAARLNEKGVKAPWRARTARPVTVPVYFRAALKRSPRAAAAFKAFPPSHKREYVEWITDAKTGETRQRRIAAALEWMASGKSRNWKYEK